MGITGGAGGKGTLEKKETVLETVQLVVFVRPLQAKPLPYNGVACLISQSSAAPASSEACPSNHRPGTTRQLGLTMRAGFWTTEVR